MKTIIREAFVNLPAGVKTPFLTSIKPHLITIEPVNACNLLCPFCATTTGLDRPIGYMKLDKFKYIIDQVKSYVTNVSLYFMGEPLLNKELFPMVRYCLAHGITPHFVTNGMFIDKYIDEFIASGLPSFLVAIDGYSKETHEKYRVKSDFPRIVNALKGLVNRKKELNSKTPRITIQSLAFGFNDIDKIKALGEEIGVDGVKIKAPRLNDHSVKVNASEVEKEYLPSDEQYARIEGMNRYPFARDMKYCPTMRMPIITWDGDVLPCCFDFRGTEPLGNIFKEDLLTLLKGSKRREVLRKYFSKTLPLCNNCDALYKF